MKVHEHRSVAQAQRFVRPGPPTPHPCTGMPVAIGISTMPSPSISVVAPLFGKEECVPGLVRVSPRSPMVLLSRKTASVRRQDRFITRKVPSWVANRRRPIYRVFDDEDT